MERLFWHQVGPLLYTGTAAWCVVCAVHQGFTDWTIAYGILTVGFLGLWVWGRR
jgi:hypothetical protein